MRTWLKIFAVVCGAVVVLVQFARPERTNPPIVRAHTAEAALAMPPGVASALERACYDCHSNETRWPWYSNVAPVSWYIARDVAEGRRHLNFSEWTRYNDREAGARLAYISWSVQNGTMPLPNYVRLHPEARLSDEEIRAIASWAENAAE